MLSILINRWHPGTCRIQHRRRGTGLPEISGNAVSASYFRKPENEKISAVFILKNAVRLVAAAAVVAFVPAAAAFPHNAIVSHRVIQHDRTVQGWSGGFSPSISLSSCRQSAEMSSRLLFRLFLRELNQVIGKGSDLGEEHRVETFFYREKNSGNIHDAQFADDIVDEF